ncbi:acetylornithine transaminase [Metabacillus arenae]|uniref:Acetylornithine aminotransferase n=1 Tax=Metabacillus arenae TaxID=2771434 RepID=A0A926S3Z0_9BACI|nr:acetylornithine transaminase [Metabacillus arenae]MBD1383449.1 acetylornithine transaminase [Metabacillus arenae]
MSYLFPNYNRWDISIKEAIGTKVIDDKGKEYLDFVSGIAVCNLGHCHPAVVEAVKAQTEQVWHVSNLFQIDLQEQVAKLLVENSSGDAVFFCNSGAEANEAAIKLARKHTGKSKVITFKQSFHGRTFATMAATGQAKVKEGFGPMLQSFDYLPYNESKKLEQLEDDTIAAIMVEVIQGEGGVHQATKEFLEKAAETCKRLNALLIIDEIQTGIGRTGKPFAYQNFGLSPDIVTVAKGLGNGFPVGAMIGKEELTSSFSPGSHGSTFGGNPLAMAAAKATLETIFQEEFLDEVTRLGNEMVQELTEKLAKCDTVEEIRGKGLMIGIQCKEETAPFITHLRQEGLLTLPAGPNVIRLLPPLNVTFEEITIAVNKISEVLNRASKVAF